MTFPTPWEEATEGEAVVRGEFHAELGAEWPGTGWFESKKADAEGRDFAIAAVHEIDGAAWPVVQVRILGRQDGGWSELELDIALNHWVAGEVPVDGEAASGRLTLANGDVHYLLDGTLDVLQAGVEPGQTVQGTFNRVTLSEVVP